MGKLDGKVAIVTGGGQGVGRGMALALAKEGAKIAIAQRTPKKAEDTAEEIRKLGAEVMLVQCDVGVRDQVNKMVQTVADKWGTVDILINNAMSSPLERFCPVESLEESDWEVLQNGVKGTWYCCMAVLPYFQENGKGKIINMGSAMGILGQYGMGPGAAAKEGIRGFSKVLAREWAGYKINVNVILPYADSPSARKIMSEFPEEIVQQAIANIPLGRQGDAETDIGPVAAFLAGPDSDYMTGQTLSVDGGSCMI